MWVNAAALDYQESWLIIMKDCESQVQRKVKGKMSLRERAVGAEGSMMVVGEVTLNNSPHSHPSQEQRFQQSRLLSR